MGRNRLHIWSRPRPLEQWLEEFLRTASNKDWIGSAFIVAQRHPQQAGDSIAAAGAERRP